MQHFDDDMNVVRHQAPSQRAIALVIEVEERVLDKRRYLWPTEPACSAPGIEFAVDAMNLILAMTHPFGNGPRQAVGKPERDELNGFRRVEVRKIPRECQPLGSAIS